MAERSIPESPAKVRVAAEDDAEALTALINAAFRKAESFFVDGDRVTSDFVRASLKKGTFLVIEEGRKLSGCVYVEINGDRAYLGLLSVDPENQRSGYRLEADECRRETSARTPDAGSSIYGLSISARNCPPSTGDMGTSKRARSHSMKQPLREFHVILCR